MTRVGIIGAGSLGRFHADRWRQLGTTISAVYDVIPAAAERLAAETNATVCPSIDAVIASSDIVDVCTPPTAHREPTIAALQAGRPVICEKPIARHLADALAMVKISEQTGVPLYIAHVVRFFPEFARVHDLIARGAIGKPGVYRSSRVGSFPRRGGWFADEAHSGGVLLDVMVHDFDFARWCCGEVERIFVRRARWEGERGGQHALAVLRFKSGAIGHIEGGWSLPPGHWHTQVEIAGDGGLVEVKGTQIKPLQAFLFSGQPAYVAEQPGDDPYLAELRHFLACITQGATPIVTSRDALAALQLSLAGIESADTGRPVTLQDLTGFSKETL